MFSNDGVNLTVDAAGYQPRQEYVLFDSSQRLISKINYPTGLVYLDANGAERQMAAVIITTTMNPIHRSSCIRIITTVQYQETHTLE